MVIKTLLPPNADLKHLFKLTAPLHIHKRRDELRMMRASPELRAVLETHGALFLASENGPNSVKVSVRYDDVAPKFEIFDLTFEAPVPMTADLTEMAVFEDWDRIDCIIAFEWLRPAGRDEAPASWDQSRYERGLRSEMPQTAEAIGVSMVGLAFGAARRDRPVGILYTDEDNPCSLLISRNSMEISQFTKNCEVVALRDFSEWKRDLIKWCGSAGKDFAYSTRNPAR